MDNNDGYQRDRPNRAGQPRSHPYEAQPPAQGAAEASDQDASSVGSLPSRTRRMRIGVHREERHALESLHEAIEDGNVEAVKEILRSDATDAELFAVQPAHDGFEVCADGKLFSDLRVPNYAIDTIENSRRHFHDSTPFTAGRKSSPMRRASLMRGGGAMYAHTVAFSRKDLLTAISYKMTNSIKPYKNSTVCTNIFKTCRRRGYKWECPMAGDEKQAEHIDVSSPAEDPKNWQVRRKVKQGKALVPAITTTTFARVPDPDLFFDGMVTHVDGSKSPAKIHRMNDPVMHEILDLSETLAEARMDGLRIINIYKLKDDRDSNKFRALTSTPISSISASGRFCAFVIASTRRNKTNSHLWSRYGQGAEHAGFSLQGNHVETVIDLNEEAGQTRYGLDCFYRKPTPNDMKEHGLPNDETLVAKCQVWLAVKLNDLELRASSSQKPGRDDANDGDGDVDMDEIEPVFALADLLEGDGDDDNDYDMAGQDG